MNKCTDQGEFMVNSRILHANRLWPKPSEDVLSGHARKMAMHDSDEPLADRDLERRVISFLEAKHVPALRYLEVKARSGVVTLTGRVYTFYEKQLCNQCCRRVPGVRQLVNEVDVIGTMPGAAVVA